MATHPDPQVQTMIDSLPGKTGRELEEWFAVLEESGLEKHGEMLKLLKGAHGMSHGYANTVAILFRERAAGGPPPADSLVDAQYAGAKADLRPIYEALLQEVRRLGGDVEVAPKKTYVSLRRSKQFAIVQPSTRTRIDLGLNLRGVTGTDRLVEGNAFGGMCTHKVGLQSAADLDDEVKGWLRSAYDLA